MGSLIAQQCVGRARARACKRRDRFGRKPFQNLDEHLGRSQNLDEHLGGAREKAP